MKICANFKFQRELAALFINADSLRLFCASHLRKASSCLGFLIWFWGRPFCGRPMVEAYMMIIYFAKCTRLACLLSFASLFYPFSGHKVVKAYYKGLFAAYVWTDFPSYSIDFGIKRDES